MVRVIPCCPAIVLPGGDAADHRISLRTVATTQRSGGDTDQFWDGNGTEHRHVHRMDQPEYQCSCGQVWRVILPFEVCVCGWHYGIEIGMSDHPLLLKTEIET